MNVSTPIDLGDNARSLAPAAPEEVGLSRRALEHIDAKLAEFIDAGELAGTVTLVARHGRLVHLHAQGRKDLASGEPLKTDTIFRMFSMTKPVTGAAMMILYDRGLWRPEDPLSKYLPSFEGVAVFDGLDADGQVKTVAPDHAPTMGELMTHTAGLSYGFMPDDPIDGLYRAARIWEQPSLGAFADVIAGLPLAYQPGAEWKYSVAMDIQGAIIERLSGLSLPDFMHDNLFAPLGMADTSFFVPAKDVDRLARLYRWGGSRGLIIAEAASLGSNHLSPPRVPSGVGGLVSTAEYYAKFSQMLLNRGEFAGRRYIEAASVDLMTTNHLSAKLLAGGYGIAHHQFRPGFGQGYDCAVFHDPAAAGMPVGKGTFQWDGAAGTWFWCDPENDLLFVGLIQRFLDPQAPQLQALTQRLVAEALL